MTLPGAAAPGPTRLSGSGRSRQVRCKTHAAGSGQPASGRCGRRAAPVAAPSQVGCDIAGRRRVSLAQGKPWDWPLGVIGLLMVLCLAAASAHADPCPAPALRFEPVGPGLWLVPAASGDSDPVNRGQVSNLLVVRDGDAPAARWWLLGSGPSPAFGRALACQMQQRLGGRPGDVVSPWARPELVLGVAGLQGAGDAPAGAPRHWAHGAVADAMAEQCPHCVERLRQRLGAAATDLGDAPIALPTHRLQGESGRLGPFLWWRLPRAEGRWLTVWRLHDRPLWIAHGLLDGSGPPDGRDADLATLQASAGRLARWAAPDGTAAQFIGEQGPVMDSGAPARHAAYWGRLLDAARAAVARGDDEAAPAPGWPGLAADWTASPRHGYNWQRAWRQVEPEVLGAPTR